ncbi:probable G-protein coupled receptor B0563.6 [Haliotis asinina]|uniref:probable G-protein coupled receptor B0563.6 n=1 Tax=Haliotis asinina TaxID=109174 RepID=UPI0035323C89
MVLLEILEDPGSRGTKGHAGRFGLNDPVALNVDGMEYSAGVVGYLFLVPCICIFGIIGNIVNILILHKGPFSGAAYVYLKGLAFFDMLSLIFILPICVIRCPVCSLAEHSWSVYEAYIYIPIGDIFIKASVVTTVVFTIERCLMICFNNHFHFEVKKAKSAIITVSIIGFLCAVENIPTFWMYHININGSIVQTDFASSTFFIFYGWLDAVLFQFIPMIVLFLFNIILIVYLRKHRHIQQHLQTPTQIAQQKFNLEQTRMIFLLIGIIVLFLITMVPSSVMQLIGYSIQFGSDVYTKFQVTTTVLIALNFSCNFLLYCAINKRFWMTFKRICCCCCQNRVHPVMDAIIAEQAVVTRMRFSHPRNHTEFTQGSSALTTGMTLTTDSARFRLNPERVDTVSECEKEYSDAGREECLQKPGPETALSDPGTSTAEAEQTSSKPLE